ncbi:MAG TPA: sigma-70 family RNA polymerase sigma factor [Bacteroidales bacterium]|nr:sigma-70 family RNA polymerase sigma factor [Bacteroidales bacterium]
MKEFSDIEIIECLRNRESYVVKYLSDKYLPLIRLMVFQNGGTKDDALDIFQDGLIIMLEKIDDLNFQLSCKFKTYLYAVCENLWKGVLDKRRAANNYMHRVAEEVVNDCSEDSDDIIYEDLFKKVFESMDTSSKEILKMYWQDIPSQEIADKLGYTYGYVRKKKCEAQNELIKKVKEHPEYKKIMNSV